MSNSINNNLARKIMAKINKGEIKSKPRAYFVWKNIAYLLINIAIFAVAVFLASFFAFALRLAGVSMILFAVVIAILTFLGLNIFLTKNLPAFYAKPLVFNLILFLLFTGLLSAVILQTPLHSKVLEYTQTNDIPFISPLYRCGCGCGCGQKAESPSSCQ